jgi:hypothetical protein
VNAQPIEPTACNSRVAVGRAAATAIASKAISVISKTTPVLVARYSAAKIDPPALFAEVAAT